MIENEVLAVIKNSIKEELNKEANETIEKLCHKFRCELGKHKNELVAELLNRIDIVTTKNSANQEIVFQINIKGGTNNGGPSNRTCDTAQKSR